MYDFPGGDGKHEWIEVYTTEPLTLTEYTFLEGGVYHGIHEFQGGTQMEAGSYAVIADDAQTFLSDNPGWSGVLFDSSFSLKNDGETLSLADGDKTVLFEVTYDTNLGENGDGNTLQMLQGTWGVGAPTPGSANSHHALPEETTESDEETNSGSTNQNSSQENSGEGNGSVPLLQPGNKRLTADAGSSKTVFVGSEVTFHGRGYGFQNEALTTARYTWNLGDGTFVEGQNILYRYHYPGQYTAVLSVSSGEYNAVDQVIVTVVRPTIVIEDVTYGTNGYVTLKNESQHPIDITSWSIHVGEQMFAFPPRSILSSYQSTPFGSYVFGFPITQGKTVQLHDTLGVPVAEYRAVKEVPISSRPQASAPTQRKVAVAKMVDPSAGAEAGSAPAPQNTEAEEDTDSEISETDEETNTGSTSTLTAGVPYSMTEGREGGIVWWIIGLVALSVIPVFALQLSKHKEVKEAEEYDIIEEE